MSTTDELRELTRQTRLRLGAAEQLRLEQRIITEQTDRRLRESRLLLEQSAQQRLAAGSALAGVTRSRLGIPLPWTTPSCSSGWTPPAGTSASSATG